jgi:hypothetical protein
MAVRISRAADQALKEREQVAKMMTVMTAPPHSLTTQP